MEVDQSNSVGFPDEERSTSSGNKDVFDFKSLRNCLPATNRHSEMILPSYKNPERSTVSLAKIKELKNCRKQLEILSHQRALLEYLVNESTFDEKEKHLEREREVPERLALPCAPPRIQEKNISTMWASERRNMDSENQGYFERKKAEHQRDISLVRANDRIRRACSSRRLPLEDMDMPERKCYRQKNSSMHIQYVLLMNEVLQLRRRVQEDIKKNIKLIRRLKEKQI